MTIRILLWACDFRVSYEERFAVSGWGDLMQIEMGK